MLLSKTAVSLGRPLVPWSIVEVINSAQGSCITYKISNNRLPTPTLHPFVDRKQAYYY